MHRRVARHLLPHSKRAFAETHNVVRGLRIQGQRNFAVAVTVSSDTAEIKKSQKRVSKDERKSMVASFVNKYRAMNSGIFPAARTVQKEVGGSYYVIRNIVQELQHKSRMPSTSTRNDTTWDAKLHKNADVILGTKVASKNSELATKEEDVPTSALEEKTLSDEIATVPAMTSGTTASLEKNKLANSEEDRRISALDDKTLSDKITTTTLAATIEVKKVELAAQEVDEPTSALDYKSFSEEIAKPSVAEDTSAETANERYLWNEEAKDSYSTTRISEDNIREKTASKVDQQQQSSDLDIVKRDPPEEHENKPFTWNLKSLADRFRKIWRKL